MLPQHFDAEDGRCLRTSGSLHRRPTKAYVTHSRANPGEHGARADVSSEMTAAAALDAAARELREELWQELTGMQTALSDADKERLDR